VHCLALGVEDLQDLTIYTTLNRDGIERGDSPKPREVNPDVARVSSCRNRRGGRGFFRGGRCCPVSLLRLPNSRQRGRAQLSGVDPALSAFRSHRP